MLFCRKDHGLTLDQLRHVKRILQNAPSSRSVELKRAGVCEVLAGSLRSLYFASPIGYYAAAIDYVEYLMREWPRSGDRSGKYPVPSGIPFMSSWTAYDLFKGTRLMWSRWFPYGRNRRALVEYLVEQVQCDISVMERNDANN